METITYNPAQMHAAIELTAALSRAELVTNTPQPDFISIAAGLTHVADAIDATTAGAGPGADDMMYLAAHDIALTERVLSPVTLTNAADSLIALVNATGDPTGLTNAAAHALLYLARYAADLRDTAIDLLTA